jgi:putative NADPH-quinone reductase
VATSKKPNPIRISIILAHPRQGSFNHALAHAVRDCLRASGHAIAFHDLYDEGFNPLFTAPELERDAELPPLVRTHCEEIAEAEGIVLVHPNWWGQPPAILKGWLDRVLRPGVAYEFKSGDSGEGVPDGLLRAKAALVLNTSDTHTRREQEVFGDPLEDLWRKCVFGFCGVKKFRRRVFNVVVTSTPAQRRKWLEEAATLAANLFNR